MTETIDTGGPAYPTRKSYTTHSNGVYGPGGVYTSEMDEGGMTKLEAYAKAALTGLMMNPRFLESHPEALAHTAFMLARAMLAEAKLGVDHD
jgi:hypothetical protein